MGKKIQKLKGSVKTEQTKPHVDQAISISARLYGMIALFILSFALYIQTYSYEYVLDDTIVITDNQYVAKGFSGIWDILTTESFQGYFGEQKDLVQGARYRPLSIVTFAIEQGLWGQSPMLSHLINAFLYSIVCLLLYVVLLQLFINYKSTQWYLSIAFVASLLYALHPLHVEAVANIKGRDEIMAMLFSLGTLLFIIKSFGSKRVFNLSIAALLFLLGLFAKENTITFLAIIPLSLYCFRPYSIKDISVAIAPLFAVVVVYLMIRINVIGYLIDSGKEITDIMNNPFAEMKSSEKAATISYTLLEYFKLSIFPHPLTHDYYPYHVPIMNWSKPASLAGLVLYTSLALASLIGIFQKQVWAYCILIYLAALSIVSNIVINVGTFMNERFLFMASMGTCLLVAYISLHTLPKWNKKIGRYMGYVIIGLSIIGYLAKDITRIPAWQNALTLNTAASKVSTNSARSNSFMATALFEEYKSLKGQSGTDIRERKIALLDQAYPYAIRAKNILPNYKNANIMLSGIAAERYNLNRDQTALLTEFKSIATSRPDVEYIMTYLEYLNDRSPDYDELLRFYYDLGYRILLNQKNLPQWAIKYMELGLKADPTNKNLHNGLGESYERLGSQYVSKANYHFSRGK